MIFGDGDRGRSFRGFLTGWLIYDMGCGMLRLARLDVPGVLHHVMGRDREKRKIFGSTGTDVVKRPSF